MPAMPPIDVVIPVYNAPVLTRHCIDSVVACLSQSIRFIFIQDDASGMETRAMLDQLPGEHIRVHHARENQGFGASVNEAIGRSDACYVLVLNSDTVVSEDFLPLLYTAFVADSRLAVIIPTGNDFAGYDLNRYVRQPGGYIQTHRLRGHAFLIRREIFRDAGGFDLAFGRGYYEDVDLGRRLNKRGWRVGVHPDAHIQHEGGGSFGRGRSFKKLVRRNRKLFFSLHPSAKRNILLLSGNCPLSCFPLNLLEALDDVFCGGGYVYWLSPEAAGMLLCLQMRTLSSGMEAAIRLFLCSWREDKRISEIWILPDVPRLRYEALTLWARICGLRILTWERTPPEENCTPRLL
ncbi:glycosyltransferase family 2 protein [Nitrosospira multiformis]|uniref:Glycosyltransferase, GT2 family n=1 Tax=Nitrosospira multiformis TaxID=1231 RepID=A0A1I7FEU6_9PROT|nr:glycosyltransferase family 2 protein [Nitrosospira multiformis]SFU34688.1 Glycosyltransferase, GT2 family [Nitrosospira multiformis]